MMLVVCVVWLLCVPSCCEEGVHFYFIVYLFPVCFRVNKGRVDIVLHVGVPCAMFDDFC